MAAADFPVTQIGDGSVPEQDSLADVIGSEAVAGDTITLQNSLVGPWTRWGASNGYVQLMPGLPLTAGTITLNLNGNTLGGTALDVVSGGGSLTFQNGTVGAAGTAFGVGYTADGAAVFQNSTLLAGSLRVGGPASTGTLTLTDSTVTASSLALNGYGSAIGATGASAITVAGPLAVTSGGRITLGTGSSLSVTGDMSFDGVGVSAPDASGNYTLTRSGMDGTGGTLSFTSRNFSVTNGAEVNLNQFAGFQQSGYYVSQGNTLRVAGVFTHAPSGESRESILTINGTFAVNGGTAVIADGGVLSRANGVVVAGGGTLTVSGVVDVPDTGDRFQSIVYANGALTIGGGSGSSTVNVLDGGLIGSITSITVGSSAAGVLNIDGVNASTGTDATASTVGFSGGLVVGAAAAGTLSITNGGVLGDVATPGDVVLGDRARATVTVDGVGTRDSRSTLYAGSLTVGRAVDATLAIRNGGLVSVLDDAVFADRAGTTTTVTVGGTGGIATVNYATLQTGGDLYVGNAGNAVFTVSNGGVVTSDGQTILGHLQGSSATVTLNYHWNAGGTAVLPGAYNAPQGNSTLTVGNGGLLTVSGLFSMAGQSAAYANNYGVATVNAGGELSLAGGSFYNRDATGAIGRVLMNGGSVLSGSGDVYAGERFTMNGGTIAAGSRGLLDFDRTGSNNRLTSIGTVHIHDSDAVTTGFTNTTFRTELDRGTQPGNTDGRSDQAVVHGNLAVDANFKVDISRVLNGEYLLVSAVDGGVISGFSPVALNTQGANSVAINLNGKTLKGNDRVDYAGGLSTELRNNNEIWLTVNSTSGGNAVTQWAGGNSNNTWDMTARNFNAGQAWAGNDQFLDGDIVEFNYANITAPNRTVNVTTDAKYTGDHATVANVAVAEVRITGGAAADQIVWNGGSILAYNSALLTTNDLVGNGATPSGQLVKDGAGTLVINNANEFYGGIVLGGPGTGTGGTVVLNNEKGFGTYDTSSGFDQKGLVYVNENTNLDVSGLNGGRGGTINNRFIVAQDRQLNFNFGSTNLNIAGNDATNSNTGQNHDGKGGGMFVSDDGGIVYTGSGALTFQQNRAQYGGGIYSELGYTFQAPTTVRNNFATQQGGGVYAERHFEMVSGSAITGNAAQNAGGGFYAGYTAVTAAGPREDLTLHGNTVVSGNLSGAETGGGGYVDAGRILNITTAADGQNGGGDVWFQDNYANVGFDPDDPVGGAHDFKNATRSAVHLSNTTSDPSLTALGAIMNITGPYNTYFYDPVSGDTGTQINVTGNNPGQPNQSGTVIMRGDSAFYGSTAVTNGATFRLESFVETDGSTVAASFGRRATTADPAGAANTFSLDGASAITGSGTIMADTVALDGRLDLDTGTFSKPAGRDGSGARDAASASTQGTLAIEGDATLAATANWNLNLTNAGGVNPRSDLVTVAGETSFSGAAGAKLTLNVDRLVHGRYTIMTSSGGFGATYTTNRRASDAAVYVPGSADNFAALPNTDPRMGRLLVTSYVDPETGTSLYLDVAGRNRYVAASSGGTWGFDPNWRYDAAYNPIGTGSTGINWTSVDTGPVTNTYLDGDMVRVTGGAYTLAGTVNPVDLFVEAGGDVSFGGSGSIKTYGLTASSLANGPDGTTIFPTGSGGINDYGIPLYTGMLYKRGANTLTFSNTGGNRFAEGVSMQGGTIAFSDGRQLTVGSGSDINFTASGTLRATATTTLATDVSVNAVAVATFDAGPGVNLTTTGVISGAGGIAKTGGGTLTVTTANTFANGTTFSGGTLVLGNNNAFNTYATPGGRQGLVQVTGAGNKTFASRATHTIQNRFQVDGIVGNGLTMDVASGTTLTVDGVNAAGLDGGAISIGPGASQLVVQGGGRLALTNNTAALGGAIYSAALDPLVLTNAMTLTGNQAAIDGGAVYANSITVNASGNMTLSGNSAAVLGGALYVNGGNLALNATGGNITFTGNTAAQGEAAYVLGVGSIAIDAGAGRLVHFQDSLAASPVLRTVTKTGTGTVAFTDNTQNVVWANTTVSGGEFRVGQGSSYGYTLATGSLTVAAGARLTGGGTINLGFGGTLNLQGTVAADSVAGLTPAGENIGALTVNGNVAITGSAAPSLSVDLGPNGGFTSPSDADLLDVSGTVTVAGTSQVVVDLHNFGTGYYRLIGSSGLNTGSFTGVNGITDPAGAFTATVNSHGLTSRHRVEFLRGNESIALDGGTTQAIGGSANDLWLSTQINNLYMNWAGGAGNVWAATNEANANWRSDDGTDERFFYNNDAVHFGTLAGDQSIDIQGGVTVTDMLVDGTTNYTFTGSGGISTSPTYAGTILDSRDGFAPGAAAPQRLVKNGNGTLSFRNTGGNTFAGGVFLNGGITGITLSNQLGSGVITFDGTGALRADANAIALANGLNVNAGRSGTVDSSTHSLTLAGTQTVQAGGTLVHTGSANGLTMVTGGVTGAGTFRRTGQGATQIETSNTFNGTTSVDGGEFRVVGGVTHGGGAAGSGFTVAAGGTVAGGGTVQAGSITIGGVISADSATLADGRRAVGTTNADRIGTLTMSGETTLTGGFRMDYDVAGTGGSRTNDLLQVTNGGLTINDGTINIRKTGGLRGDYQIMTTDGRAIVINGTANDPNSILTTQLNGNAFATQVTVRGDYTYELRNGSSELWLTVSSNSLDMVWQNPGGVNNVWTATGGGANWLSEQGTAGLNKERVFQNGDYVHFTQTGAPESIRIDGDVLVSGMEVAANSDYTFTGSGGISAVTTDGSIEGDYVDGTLTPVLVPDGKLTKRGSGMLVFHNDAANSFENGIDIYGGGIAFNRLDHLGTADIHFLGNGTIRTDADGMNLTNDILIDQSVTANFDTNSHTLALLGVISGDGNLAKSGTGVLSLSGADNTYTGLTTVNGGTLIAVGAGQLGASLASREIQIATGANLLVRTDAGSDTLNQLLTGGGNLEKSGVGDLVLTNAGNTYGGTTGVTAGRVIATSVGAINGANDAEVDIFAGSTLEMQLNGAAASGTMNKRLSGEGGLVHSGGGSTLTLTNAASDYQGGTVINGGTAGNRLIATSANAVGTGDIAVTNAADVFEIANSADGTLAQVISGDGRLVKSDTGTVTLGGTNTFAGGTEWNGGNITLANESGLSTTTAAAGSVAGFVTVNTSGTLTAAEGVATVQNRFDVTGGNRLTFAPSGSLTIRGNNLTGGAGGPVNGGAIALGAGASFATSQPLFVNGNSTDGSGGGIYGPDADLVYGAASTGVNAVAELTGNTAGGDGGGAYVRSVTINSVPGTTVIQGNQSGGRGGAFYLAGGDASTPAQSRIDTSNGIVAFRNNTDSTGNNAMHMAANNTLTVTGASAVYMYDGISSTDTGRNNNRVVVDLQNRRDLGSAFNLYGVSDYYGDTEVASGVMMLRDNATEWGRQSGDGNRYELRQNGVLAGYGTIGADLIDLGGTVSAGDFTANRRPGSAPDIATLGFTGDVRIGTLDQRARATLGQTLLDIDLRAIQTGVQSADLMNITGALYIDGVSRSDLNTFVAGRHKIIATTDGVYNSNALVTGTNVDITDRFTTTIGGNAVNTSRHEIHYYVDDGDGTRNVYLDAMIDSDYLRWTGANTFAPENGGNVNPALNPFNPDGTYDNKWLNSPLYNWEDASNVAQRFDQRDLVVFDSVADLGNVAARDNIEIITTPQDNQQPDPGTAPSERSNAVVGDMYVTGGGTYRFTGQGIEAIANDSYPVSPELARGQLYIDGGSTAILANGANNFGRGIELNHGTVAFNDVDQLGTIMQNDSLNGNQDTAHGIIVSGANSYGGLTANADGMVLGIPVNIADGSSVFVVDTGGIGNGDPGAVGSHTLTMRHSAVPAHNGANGIYGAGALAKTGDGTLILQDQNYYEGGTFIEGGVLQVAADNRMGAADGFVVLDGGTLRASQSFTTARNIYIDETDDPAAQSAIDVASGKDLTVTGVVADAPDNSGDDSVVPDALVKLGSGTLILDNAGNTYAGGTDIQEGRVVAMGAGAFGDDAGAGAINTVNNGGVRSTAEVMVAGGDDETLLHQLTGNGNFVKSGSGRLSLTDTASPFAGNLEATGGELHLANGANFGDTESFRIGDGATLTGTGTLGIDNANGNGRGVIDFGGRLRPNGVVANDPDVNPTSTPLTITGQGTGSEFVFASGSTYEVTLTQYPNPNGSERMVPVSDRIDVSNATVQIEQGATLDVDIDYWANRLGPLDFGEDTSGPFTIIDASAGTVGDSGAQFDLGNVYLPRGVELLQGWNGSLYQLYFQGDPMLPCEGLNLTRNQLEVCKLINQITGNRDPNPDITELLRIITQHYDDNTLVHIYEQLQGDLRANGLAMALKQPWRHPFARLGGTPFAVLAGMVEPEEAYASFADPRPYQEFWAEGYGRYSTVRTDGNSMRNRIDRVGGVFGYDRQLSLNTVMGVVFNYSNPRLKQSTGSVKMDDYEIGLYNLTRFGLFDLKAYAGYAYQRYDISRSVFIPSGGRYDAVYNNFSNKVNGHALSASLELTRLFQPTSRLNLSPVLALDYEQAWMKGYTETGGITALRYDDADFARIEARAGVQVEAQLTCNLNLTGRVQYSRQLNSDTPRSEQRFAASTVATDAMRIWGVKRGRNALNVGVGLEYHFNQDKSRGMYVNYDGDFRSKESTHTGNLGVFWGF